jgi:hypothetical protein
VKDVVEGPMMGIVWTIERFGFEKVSFRVRLIGDIPFMESMDVAGDAPSEMYERRFRAC